RSAEEFSSRNPIQPAAAKQSSTRASPRVLRASRDRSAEEFSSRNPLQPTPQAASPSLPAALPRPIGRRVFVSKPDSTSRCQTRLHSGFSSRPTSQSRPIGRRVFVSQPASTNPPGGLPLPTRGPSAPDRQKSFRLETRFNQPLPNKAPLGLLLASYEPVA